MLLFILCIFLSMYFARLLIASYIPYLWHNFTSYLWSFVRFGASCEQQVKATYKENAAADIKRDCDRLGVLSDNSEYELYFKDYGI